MAKAKVATNTVVARIQQHDVGRDPALLQRKYQAMAGDAFTFLRGTAHLFYADWPRDSPLNDAPLAWICGDLHLENLGSYRGDNRLVYFDQNDFDEASLAPVTWDLARFLTSLLVAAPALEIPEAEAEALGQAFLDRYRLRLREGKAGWIERSLAVGIVRDILFGLKRRTARQLLDSLTVRKGSTRKLRIDDVHTLPVSATEREAVTTLVQQFAVAQPDPAFFTLHDVARRVAGTGSLGLARYLLLVEGHGTPERNLLLDLKREVPSALTPYVPVPQPPWTNEAERVVAVQRWVQAVSPAFLVAIGSADASFSLRELQPIADRLALTLMEGKDQRIREVIETVAEVVAWGHLRGRARQGASTTDALIAYGAIESWAPMLLAYARKYREQVDADWRTFRKAWKAGALASHAHDERR